MKPLRGPIGYLRALRLAALAAFAACLNPQPDDNPLGRPVAEDPAVQGSSPDTKAPNPSIVFNDDEMESPDSAKPPMAQPTEAPPLSGGAGADAGAPPPLEDAGNLRQGDLVEADAGPD